MSFTLPREYIERARVAYAHAPATEMSRLMGCPPPGAHLTPEELHEAAKVYAEQERRNSQILYDVQMNNWRQKYKKYKEAHPNNYFGQDGDNDEYVPHDLEKFKPRAPHSAWSDAYYDFVVAAKHCVPRESGLDHEIATRAINWSKAVKTPLIHGLLQQQYILNWIPTSQYDSLLWYFTHRVRDEAIHLLINSGWVSKEICEIFHNHIHAKRYFQLANLHSFFTQHMGLGDLVANLIGQFCSADITIRTHLRSRRCTVTRRRKAIEYTSSTNEQKRSPSPCPSPSSPAAAAANNGAATSSSSMFPEGNA
jgi:hypothetical protein